MYLQVLIIIVQHNKTVDVYRLCSDHDVKVIQSPSFRWLSICSVNPNPAEQESHGFKEWIIKAVDAEGVEPRDGHICHGEVTNQWSQAPDVVKCEARKLTSPATCIWYSTDISAK